MSDFDKEAEREKLREKYERDQADREATKRMSDLLLKGARMTNTHCGTCGDPLFEQNGVTFCPTCHGGPEGVEASPDEETDATEGTTDAETAGGQAPNAGEATVDAGEGSTGTDAATTADEGITAEASDADGDANSGATTDDEHRDETRSIEEEPDESDEPRARVEIPSDRRVRAPSGNGDFEAAREALVDSLERFARRAAETDDPRYAKECLQAAREAAGALERLR